MYKDDDSRSAPAPAQFPTPRSSPAIAHSERQSERGIAVDIPGARTLRIDTLLTDYTGTLSYGGAATAEVTSLLRQVAASIDIRILTADTFGTADREIGFLPLEVVKLAPEAQDEQKARCAAEYDLSRAAAFGNGANDRLMLRAVRQAGGLAVAVDNGEGCAVAALLEAEVFVTGAANALLLLLEPDRLKATLRR